jgi:hypothetical protein
MMSDSVLSDAGWLFFTAWSVVVGAVSIAAFGHDLLPSKPLLKSRTHPRSPNSAPSHHPHPH